MPRPGSPQTQRRPGCFPPQHLEAEHGDRLSFPEAVPQVLKCVDSPPTCTPTCALQGEPCSAFRTLGKILPSYGGLHLLGQIAGVRGWGTSPPRQDRRGEAMGDVPSLRSQG